MANFSSNLSPTSMNMDTQYYHGMFLLSTEQGAPVAVLRSKSPEFPCWCVLKGFSSTFFRTYKETQDFCNNHNYKPFKGGYVTCKL